MIVCICAGVSDKTVLEMLPHMTLEEFKSVTGACQQCCKCCDALDELQKQIKLLGEPL